MRSAAKVLALLCVPGMSSEVQVKVQDASSASFPTEALEADDQCSSEGCGSAFLQTSGLALRANGVDGDNSFKRKSAKVPPKTDDAMYAWLQTARPGPWGDTIDAGTGPSSLTWLASCPLHSITAVTANESSKASTLHETKEYLDFSLDKVVVGLWQDPKFLRGQQFDTVVADWLLGSVEYFAPHYQVSLIRRLHKLVKPGGWMLVSGREPDHFKAKNSTGVQMMFDIDNLRDAASLLAEKHPYRELPQWWVEEELVALGFKIHKTNQEPVTLSHEYVQSQIEWAGDNIKLVQDDNLRSALEQRHKAIERRSRETTDEWLDMDYTNNYGIIARLV